MGKTSYKSPKEISEVRRLYEQESLAIKAIARELKYSVNTVRKIIRHVYGYEGDTFNAGERWKNSGDKKRANANYVSEIDGELLTITQGSDADGYLRISKYKYRETLHTYEAKKAYRLLDKKWSCHNIVHHIDGDRTNCSLDNLAILTSRSLHRNYHARLGRLMYRYLIENDLLTDFYKKNPSMKLETIKDISLQF